jgi:polysaccharide biosynthesis transport protein
LQDTLFTEGYDVKQIPSDDYLQIPPAPGYPYLYPMEEKEVHLRDYWKVIRKRAWMVLAIFLIAVVITAVKAYTTKPVYRGTACIQINIENPQVVDFKEIFTVNMWAQDYYKTQYKILESRSLARRVVRKLRLSEHPEFLPQAPSPFQAMKSNLLSSARSFLRSMIPLSSADKETSSTKDRSSSIDESDNEKDAPLVSAFLGRLRIEPLTESRLVRIHFEAYDPALAG